MPERVVRKEYMSDITLTLKDIQDVKTLKIDEVGEFEVRKLSAPEQLDLQAKRRRAAFIVSELYASGINKFKDKKDSDLSEDDIKELNSIKERAEKLGQEIEDIKKYENALSQRRFKDLSGGKAVEKLFETLSNEGIAKIFEAMFDEKIEVTQDM